MTKRSLLKASDDKYDMKKKLIEMANTTIYIPKKGLEALDRIVETTGIFPSRAEAFRYMLNNFLAEFTTIGHRIDQVANKQWEYVLQPKEVMEKIE